MLLMLLMRMVLRLHGVSKWIITVEVVRSHGVAEGEVHHSTSLHARLARRIRKRRTDTHIHTHSRRVKITCLVVVDRVGASRCWCIVAGRLVGEALKCIRVDIQQRWSEPPCFIIMGSGRRVQVFEVVMTDLFWPVVVDS